MIFGNTPMLVFILLTMMMGGVVLLSASLFYLNSGQAAGITDQSKSQRSVSGVVFDDVELPVLAQPRSPADKQAAGLLDFTRIAGKRSNQLPLLGMPDKAFYHIH